MITQQLEQIGLSEKEAKVYTTLLKIGPSVASVLARITGIKRTSIYDILNSLIQKDLITQNKKNNYTYYLIDDPNKIVLHEKEKLYIARELVKEIKEIQTNNEPIQVSHYKGPEGYKEVYEHILKVKPKELLGWINLDFHYQMLEEAYENSWTKQRIKNKIQVKLILQDTKVGRLYKSNEGISSKEAKFIPKNKFPFKTTCFIYDNYISLFDPSHDITGIKIYNPELANMQKQIFKMNWDILK